MLAENWATNGEVCERFIAEARLLRRIDDPSVVRVHDVGVARLDAGLPRPYFVMDLVRGGTLADRIGALHPRDALLLAAKAADAVQRLHDAEALHRDLKPSNLLMEDARSSCRVIVAGLGNAKLLADASTLTMVAGSPAYMPPEQALTHGLDARADVYALGAVAYHLLSGRLPYDVASPAGVRSRPPGPPPALAAELALAPQLDDVLARALALEPDDRFSTAADLGTALRRLAHGESVDLPRTVRRWPVRLVALAAAAVVLVAAAAGWYLS